MRITSSVEYATRLMVRLARHGGRPVPADRLSKEENVPPDYVNQLLLRLRRAGLIESQRGSGGGYALKQPPASVTLAQVIRAVDGKVFEGVCGKYEGDKDCRHQGQCGISPVWDRLGGLIERYVEDITLQRLLDEDRGCVKFDFLEKASGGRG